LIARYWRIIGVASAGMVGLSGTKLPREEFDLAHVDRAVHVDERWTISWAVNAVRKSGVQRGMAVLAQFVDYRQYACPNRERNSRWRAASSEAMVSNEMGDLDGDSLIMHRSGRPGKIEIIATKPLVTQRDLALAYSPGVAAPCLEIAKEPSTRLRLHDQGQPGRRDLQRHGGAGPGRHLGRWPASR
jgi:hypothetical protein